jgi:hypothetical protein
MRSGLWLAEMGQLPTATNGCLPVAQFVAGQEPFVADFNVSIAVTSQYIRLQCASFGRS